MCKVLILKTLIFGAGDYGKVPGIYDFINQSFLEMIWNGERESEKGKMKGWKGLKNTEIGKAALSDTLRRKDGVRPFAMNGQRKSRQAARCISLTVLCCR